MSKKQKTNKNESKRGAEVKPRNERNLCTELSRSVDELLQQKQYFKANTLKPCTDKQHDCGCQSDAGEVTKGQKVDLIVLMDTSGSMGGSFTAISNAIASALEEVKKSCAPDLNLLFLGVDGTWPSGLPNNLTPSTDSSPGAPGSKFYNHRTYLQEIRGAGVVLAADAGHVGYKPEQGANAIQDLSNYIKWREKACRAIFYISDEELDSIDPRGDFANETAATNAAILAANAHQVSVFAHFINDQGLGSQIKQNYSDLCQQTGGELYYTTDSNPGTEEYVQLMTRVICYACGRKPCRSIQPHDIQPCISIKWGDSKCDCLESSDYEVMTIEVCNCYGNLTFENFIISHMIVLDENNNQVPLLPNGTPSIQLIPVGVYCFGNIGPCSCVVREFVLINEGAKEGKYKILLRGICFDVSTKYQLKESCFEFEVCKD